MTRLSRKPLQLLHLLALLLTIASVFVSAQGPSASPPVPSPSPPPPPSPSPLPPSPSPLPPSPSPPPPSPLPPTTTTTRTTTVPSPVPSPSRVVPSDEPEPSVSVQPVSVQTTTRSTAPLSSDPTTGSVPTGPNGVPFPTSGASPSSTGDPGANGGGLSSIAIAGIALASVSTLAFIAAAIFVAKRTKKLEKLPMSAPKRRSILSDRNSFSSSRGGQFDAQFTPPPKAPSPSQDLLIPQYAPGGSTGYPQYPPGSPRYAYANGPTTTSEYGYAVQSPEVQYAYVQPGQPQDQDGGFIPNGAPSGFYYTQVSMPPELAAGEAPVAGVEGGIVRPQSSQFVQYYQDPAHPQYYFDAVNNQWFAATLRG